MLKAFRELFAYRAPICSLAVWDVKTRYRGPAVGFHWTFLNPLLVMATHDSVFSVYTRIELVSTRSLSFQGFSRGSGFLSSLLMGSTSIVEGGGLLESQE